jgi:iron-sulfur cluster assembly protein
MLTLTDDATAVATTLVSRRTDAVDAGLRIHATDAKAEGGARLAVVVADHPEAFDQILQISGTRLFVDEAAAAVLDDKVLDAGIDETGAVSFSVLPQEV